MTSALASGSSRYVLPVRVYYQDTDAGGVVHHGTYLDFLERARTEWLRRMGLELSAWAEAEGSMLIVRHLEVAYRAPARLDDLLDVSAEVTELGRAQFTLAQQVCRGEELLVRATVNLACVSVAQLRPRALPENLRILLAVRAGQHDKEMK